MARVDRVFGDFILSNKSGVNKNKKKSKKYFDPSKLENNDQTEYNNFEFDELDLID